MSNPHDFFLDIDPTRPPKRPEQFPEEYDDNIEEDCSSCGKQFGIHTTRELVVCALTELRGGIKT